MFVLDASDQARLSETWEVFGEFSGLVDALTTDEVLNSPRLLNLPLLLLANKQDLPNSLSVAEVRELFDAWQRARPQPKRRESDASHPDGEDPSSPIEERRAERLASLDVMGVSALEG